MKALVFDSGPLISLTMNNLLWLIEPLKKMFNGRFYIAESVKLELVEEPLATKKFKFEALQLQEYINKGALEVLEDSKTKAQTLPLLALANNCFSAEGKNLTLLHYGEVASIACAIAVEASAVVMDERVTRELVEHPLHLAQIMGEKLRTQLQINKEKISQFREKTEGIAIIRSTELATIAFEKGLLERYQPDNSANARKLVLESVLWGLKLDGCAINERGIKAILNSEFKD